MNKSTIEILNQQKLLLVELISNQLVKNLQIKDYTTTEGLQKALQINDQLIKSISHED